MQRPFIMPSQISAEQIRLIASDIDGTLLNEEHQISEATISYLRQLNEKYAHIPFVLATGKSLHGASHVLRHLDFLDSSYGIFVNGAVVLTKKNSRMASSHSSLPLKEHHSIDGYYVCHEQPMEDIDSNWLLSYILKFNVPAVIYHYNKLISFSDPDSHPENIRLINSLAKFHEPEIEYITESRSYSGKSRLQVIQDIQSGTFKIHKIIFFAEPERKSELMNHIAEQAGFSSLKAQWIPTQPEMLEVQHTKTSKSQAIQFLCKLFGIEMDHVIAFGDGTNDEEMIRDVGLGVAMGNAVQEIMSIADAVTKTNDEHGVVDFLNQLFPCY